MRTTLAVAVVALLAMPATVRSEGDPHRDRQHDNRGVGRRIERDVPEPATVLLLGAAGGVAYGVRKLRSKQR
jgi:hypothetical protein